MFPTSEQTKTEAFHFFLEFMSLIINIKASSYFQTLTVVSSDDEMSQ